MHRQECCSILLQQGRYTTRSAYYNILDPQARVLQNTSVLQNACAAR